MDLDRQFTIFVDGINNKHVFLMKFRSKKSGFTLVELIISLSLVGIVMAGLFSLHGQSLRLIEDSRHLTRVSQILQSEMENMRTMNWNDISGMPFYATFEPSGRFSEAFSDRYVCYRFMIPKGTNLEQRETILIAQWRNSRGTLETQVYRTVFSREGINDYYYRAF